MNRRTFSLGLLSGIISTRMHTLAAQTPVATAIVDVPQAQPVVDTSDPDVYVGALVGRDDAPARMFVYSDTQSQYCQRFYREHLPNLLEDYVEPGEILIEYRDYPILGRGGLAAEVNTSSYEAQALLAAGEQNAYFKLLEAMMQRHHVHSNDVIASVGTLAEGIGIDADAVTARLEEGWYVPVLQAAVQDGRRRGVTGVPSFQIGPTDDRAAVMDAPLLLLPVSGYDDLRKTIDNALANLN